MGDGMLPIEPRRFASSQGRAGRRHFATTEAWVSRNEVLARIDARIRSRTRLTPPDARHDDAAMSAKSVAFAFCVAALVACVAPESPDAEQPARQQPAASDQASRQAGDAVPPLSAELVTHMDSSEREKSISHHVEVLMYHDTGDPGFRATVRQFAEMWEDLVPDNGEAESGQGELLRAIGRLAGEDRRNGCCNWDDFYESRVAFLRDHLPHEAVFASPQQARILRDLHLVAENGKDGLDAEEMRTVFGRLIMDVVAYCRAQSATMRRDQLPRAKVQNLQTPPGRKPWWRFW
ncbi:MAG TPA: hypothetical protein VF384_19895 [Planctomycetota bacterium]